MSGCRGIHPLGLWGLRQRFANLVAAALWVRSCRVCRAQFDVPGAVSVSPTDQIFDAIGLGDLFGSGHKNVATLWYFWLIIAVVIIFVIVGSFFTYRGFKRWKTVREENRLKFLVKGTAGVQYFDEQTEDWIIDMSKRTGRSVSQCKAAGARHCAGQVVPGKSRELNKAMTMAAHNRKRDLDDLDLEEGSPKAAVPRVGKSETIYEDAL